MKFGNKNPRSDRLTIFFILPSEDSSRGDVEKVSMSGIRILMEISFHLSAGDVCLLPTHSFIFIHFHLIPSPSASRSEWRFSLSLRGLKFAFSEMETFAGSRNRRERAAVTKERVVIMNAWGAKWGLTSFYAKAGKWLKIQDVINEGSWNKWQNKLVINIRTKKSGEKARGSFFSRKTSTIVDERNLLAPSLASDGERGKNFE